MLIVQARIYRGDINWRFFHKSNVCARKGHFFELRIISLILPRVIKNTKSASITPAIRWLKLNNLYFQHD